MRISLTSEKLLTIFFSNPNQEFFVNELIRKTGLYPNSVQKSLLTLTKQKILSSSRSGRFKFYRIDRTYEFLPEIKQMVLGKTEVEFVDEENKYNWAKILNRQTSYSFTAALCVSNIKKLKEIYGVSVPNFWHNSITFGVYYLRNDLAFLGEAISKKIEADLDFAKKDIALCRQVCDQLIKVAKQIPLKDLPHKKDQQITHLFVNFYNYYLAVFPFVTSPHGIENYFERTIKEEVKNEEDLKILLSPASNKDEERDAALKIAAYAKKYGFDKEFYKLLDKHCENYCWLPLWSIYAEPLTREYFESEIKNILKKVNNPQKELKKLEAENSKAQRNLQNTFIKIKASRLLKEKVKLLQEYISLRLLRKNAICQAHFYHLPLFYEATRRLDLSLEEAKLLSYQEIMDGLLIKASQKGLKSLAKDRQKGWAILVWQEKVKTITGTKNIIETMERYRIIAPSSAMQRAVKGHVACRGKATGKVKVVKKLSELSKVQEGDILVTKMTTPDYVMAMHKAAAIVTDEGGITCHAAIVSREFNIPCIVATKNATQILSDNDLVEVDAIEGVVRVIESTEAPEDIKVISGKTIYQGKVRGIARIVLDAADFTKVKSGDILIAPQTTPEYLSSLYRVKGFIVDEESLTSHAVLYGKALKLPSIMGTEFARNVIQDGEEIELDATKGLVKRLV